MSASALSPHEQKYIHGTACLLIAATCFEVGNYLIIGAIAKNVFAFLSASFFIGAIASFTAEIKGNTFDFKDSFQFYASGICHIVSNILVRVSMIFPLSLYHLPPISQKRAFS